MKTTEKLLTSLELSAKELEACATSYDYIVGTEEKTEDDDEKTC